MENKKMDENIRKLATERKITPEVLQDRAKYENIKEEFIQEFINTGKSLEDAKENANYVLNAMRKQEGLTYSEEKNEETVEKTEEDIDIDKDLQEIAEELESEEVDEETQELLNQLEEMSNEKVENDNKEEGNLEADIAKKIEEETKDNVTISQINKQTKTLKEIVKDKMKSIYNKINKGNERE